MRFNWKTEIVPWLLLAGMVGLALASWSGAPERIPVHWNFAGHVDRYGGRFEGLFGFPLAALALYLVLLLLPRLDPGRANYARFAGAYNVLRTGILVLFAGFQVLVLLAVHGKPLEFGATLPVLAGAMFILLGNLLGKIRPNWFMGIRTPWTLSSKQSWTKTHRLGGWLFVAAGLVCVASGLLRAQWSSYVVGGTLAVIVVVVMVYSYWVWRGDPDKIPPAGTLPG